MKNIPYLPFRLTSFIFFSLASVPQMLAVGSEDFNQATTGPTPAVESIVLPPLVPANRLTPLPHPQTVAQERALQAAVNSAQRQQRPQLPFLSELRQRQNLHAVAEEVKNEETEEVQYEIDLEETDATPPQPGTPNEAFQSELQERLAQIRTQLAPFTIGNSITESILRSTLQGSILVNPITNEDFINDIIKRCQQRADANGDNLEQSLLDEMAENNALIQSIIYENPVNTEVLPPAEISPAELDLLTELEIEQLILTAIALYLEFGVVCATQDTHAQYEENEYQRRMTESRQAIHSHADDSEQGRIYADARRIRQNLARQQEANAALYTQIRAAFQRSINLLARAFGGNFNNLLPILQQYAARLANPNDPSKTEFSSHYAQVINDINELVRKELNIPEPQQSSSWFSWIPSFWSSAK